MPFTVKVHPAHAGMLLEQMLKNNFDETYGKPKGYQRMQKTQIIKNHSTQAHFAHSAIKKTRVINAAFSLIKCREIVFDNRPQ